MSERVVLREFSSRGDAEVVRELLLANDIEAFVAILRPKLTELHGHGEHWTNVQTLALSDYVFSATGRRYDDLVGTLAAAATGRPTDRPIAVRRLRRERESRDDLARPLTAGKQAT